MKRFKTVEGYIQSTTKWTEELNYLRDLIAKTSLEETVKWGMPTYTISNKNVVGLSGFKDHFGLWFFQGVFLKDPYKILVNAQTGKTKGMRQLRFAKGDSLDESVILEYLEEAIQNQLEGKEIEIEKKPLIMPSLLQEALESDEALNEGFEKFSTSKKREFAEYIEDAKRETTKINRMQKIIPMIIKGIGLNDKYR